jgi:hypothetical protein
VPYLRDFGDFQIRVAPLGLRHLELLTPILTLDVSFLGWSILAADEDIALMEQLHRVLFPGRPFHFKDTIAAAGPRADPDIIERKWRNRLLDVQALWCHIHHGGDVFVTSDGRLHSQQKREPTSCPGSGQYPTAVRRTQRHTRLGCLARIDARWLHASVPGTAGPPELEPAGSRRPRGLKLDRGEFTRVQGIQCRTVIYACAGAPSRPEGDSSLVQSP